MSVLLTILFTVFGIGMIIYFLLYTGEKDIDKMTQKRLQREAEFKGADPKKVYSKNWDPKIPRPRICPACGTALKKTEYLYAAMEEEVEGQKRQVHIYGCRYCYLGKADSQENIQENLDI